MTKDTDKIDEVLLWKQVRLGDQEVFIKIWNARGKIDVYASFELFL